MTTKTKKAFTVSFDMKFSHEINLLANSKGEAKKKAVEKFLKKLKSSDFNIDVDHIN